MLPPQFPGGQPTKLHNRFLDWFIPVADSIIDALYHEDSAVKKNVIRLLFPLSTQFASRSVPSIPLSTPCLINLNENYRKSLEIEQKLVQTRTRKIVERINTFCSICLREEEQAKETIDNLKASAKKLAAEYKEPTFHRIIAQQLLRATGIVNKEKYLRILIARTEAHNTQTCDVNIDTKSIDQEIYNQELICQNNYGPDLIAAMRQTYESNICNVDYEAAN